MSEFIVDRMDITIPGDNSVGIPTVYLTMENMNLPVDDIPRVRRKISELFMYLYGNTALVDFNASDYDMRGF